MAKNYFPVSSCLRHTREGGYPFILHRALDSLSPWRRRGLRGNDDREVISRHMLRESQQPVENIAAQVGFESLTAFHRAFKGWTGTTPLAYRRKGERRTGDRHRPKGE